VLDVHDDIDEVQQNPAALPGTLASHRLGTGGAHLLLHRVDDRLHLALIGRRGDHEAIGDDQLLGHVQQNQVVGLFVRRCLRRDQPGPYQLQAAINAVHSDAATFEETDWSQIVALYDRLLELVPTPVVALNRAIAIGELEGPAAAFELVDQLDLGGYQPFHAARADLLRRLGRAEEAAIEYDRAAALAPTEAEREFLRWRMVS
jgi:hypothetical protein